MQCPRCGFGNPSRMRFCGQCGAPLSSVPSREERKLVTVLFADIVGSTQLTAVRDPEHVQAQIDRFFAIARDEVHRHGGTVEKYIGDAVLALFGFPAVHEDDPERAARAAVAMRDRVDGDREAGALPKIRIGITMGEVVVATHSSGTGERLVTGEAVNLASRLQQYAQSGQILVAEHVQRALRDAAALLRIPSAITLKGVPAPVPAWDLVAVGPPREREMRATPFVGREGELGLLTECVRRVQREGRGRAVTMLGPAGVGKTRLARELRGRIDGVRILRGRALPYGTGVPFSPLGEAIREECGILFGDPLDVARGKLRETAARLEVDDAVPALLIVLGLGEGAHDLSREVLFARTWMFFEAVARRSPLLLIAEDIHSADEWTLDFIERGADRLRDFPFLLLTLARPELLERRPSWMRGRPDATILTLEPLAGGESRELILGVLRGRPVPAAFPDLVLERAEGNPLFIEEILRTLLEQGVLVDDGSRWALTVPLARITIPDSVQAVIEARIDALPGPEKQLLQTAAVVGRDFWLGAVRTLDEHLAGDALRGLIDKGVVAARPRSTLVNETEFAFTHILIRDVAYRMLPKTQRWPKHLRFAEWLHQIAGDRRAEFADIIAHHWLQVISLRNELSLPPEPRAREQAIANLLVAAAQASRLYANNTALDHYARALELAPPPEERLAALLGRGEVWMLLARHERAREDFGSVRAHAQDSGARRWEILALDRLGHSFRRQDQIAQALEHLEEALRLSRDLGEASLTGQILNHIGFTYFSQARYEDAIRMHLEARSVLEHHDVAGLAESLHGLGDNAVLLGRFEEGMRWLSDSAVLCEQIGNRSLAGENRYVIAVCRDLLGDTAAAQNEVERSVTALAEIGDTWRLSFALSAAARVAIPLGQFDKAIDCATRGLRAAREIGAGRAAIFNLLCLGLVYRELEDFRRAWQADQDAAELVRAGEIGGFWRPGVLASLALDSAALGRTQDAQAYVHEARQAVTEGPTRGDFPEEIAHAEGRVLLAAGRPADARDAALRLADLVASNKLRRWRVPALLLRADAAVALGEAAEAVTLYEIAADEAGRLGRLPGLWRALAGLAEVRHAEGDKTAARESAVRARDITARLAAGLPDKVLQAAFLQSARVARIVALSV
ncbi:MAG TPA: tetratricopeptide repeat protein [bacterium]|nr:tetratricopeptide repeat protein [bacterium]